jgi:hypothetical protein
MSRISSNGIAPKIGSGQPMIRAKKVFIVMNLMINGRRSRAGIIFVLLISTGVPGLLDLIESLLFYMNVPALR